MNYAKHLFIVLTLLSVAALEFGCGQGGEESGVISPSKILTASSVTSQVNATGHIHVVSIPFTDVTASPANDIFQYRSGSTNGHTHVIALSKQQMIDLNNGMRLVLTSSEPSSWASHTHTWDVFGGTLLYDKNCYNCHGNANRGRSPMNVSFNASQVSAEMSPSTAPMSYATAAIPDPNYIPPSLSLDGGALYTANCSSISCHGPLATSTKSNKTFSQIKAAITNNTGGMGSLGGLTDLQLKAIAKALVK